MIVIETLCAPRAIGSYQVVGQERGSANGRAAGEPRMWLQAKRQCDPQADMVLRDTRVLTQFWIAGRWLHSRPEPPTGTQLPLYHLQQLVLLLPLLVPVPLQLLLVVHM